MKLYCIVDRYVSFICAFDQNVMRHKTTGFSRKYLGAVFQIDGHDYYVPLSSPKPKDFLSINGVKTVRPNNATTIFITDATNAGMTELKGTLPLNRMIPVPVAALIPYDIRLEPDPQYRALLIKEWNYIYKHQTEIVRRAQNLRSMRINGTLLPGFAAVCVDFLSLESHASEWF